MKARSATLAAVLVLGVVGSTSSAMAFPYGASVDRVAPSSGYEGQGRSTRGAHDGPLFTRCPQSSAAEGNARQQNFPVKQYGQTSGGPRC